MKKGLWFGTLALFAVGCGGSGNNDRNDDAGNEIPAVSVAGVTSGNRLVIFNSNAPDTLTTDVAITGLPSGAEVAGLDYRPSNGAYYLMTENGGLYTLDLSTGAAVAVGTIQTNGQDVEEIDFNPVADRLRVATDDNGSLRVNVADAATTVDTSFAYVGGTRAEIKAVAYTNSVAGATSTAFYGIDVEQNALVKIDPPNEGVLTRVGGLGINVDDPVPFDIGPVNAGFGLMAVETNGRSRLVSVSTTDGSTVQGRLTPRGRVLVGLTILPN